MKSKIRNQEFGFLTKSGILAVIITFVLLGFWFGFSKLSLGYDPNNLTKQILKKDSAVQETLIGLVGTYTTWQIVVGTTSVTWVGTSTDTTLPRLVFNGATGLWEIKGLAGTQTVPIGTISAAYLSTFGSDYVLKNSGSSTGQLLTNATLAGSTTIGTGSTITAGTQSFNADKVRFLSDVDAPLGDSIASKLSRLGTHTSYLNSITVDGKTGTTSFSLAGGSGITFTATSNPDGSLAITADASGSATAKTDVQIGGTTTTSNASAINFPARPYPSVNFLSSEVKKVEMPEFTG